jgi:hypothetical protein
MAQRPIFLPEGEGVFAVRTLDVDFHWFPGLAPSQKKKSVRALHDAATQLVPQLRALEISSKSEFSLGVALSAFNLLIETRKHHRCFSVECAYQASKVFERGGPFIDLLAVTSREAKSDERLRTSGRLVGFRFFGEDWPLEPFTAFYDWLYLNALNNQPSLVEQLTVFNGFTDIEFNPERSVNCQAYSVALFLSLRLRGRLQEALSSPLKFRSVVSEYRVSVPHRNEHVQPRLA